MARYFRSLISRNEHQVIVYDDDVNDLQMTRLVKTYYLIILCYIILFFNYHSQRLSSRSVSAPVDTCTEWVEVVLCEYS